MNPEKGWPVMPGLELEPLHLPPRPGIKKPTTPFYTTDCPVCHKPHRTSSDYVDCRIDRRAW